MNLGLESMICSEEAKFLKKFLNFAINPFKFLFKRIFSAKNGFSTKNRSWVSDKYKALSKTGIWYQNDQFNIRKEISAF